jgi:TPR repeat protein
VKPRGRLGAAKSLLSEYGIGVPQDLSQAVKWYRQAAAKDYADAQIQKKRVVFEVEPQS